MTALLSKRAKVTIYSEYDTYPMAAFLLTDISNEMKRPGEAVAFVVAVAFARPQPVRAAPGTCDAESDRTRPNHSMACG